MMKPSRQWSLTTKQLPYPRACLDESLRFYPPNSHTLPRRTPPEGLNIMEQYTAGHISVGVSALVVHKNEAVFPQVDKYIPERWLGEDGKDLQPYFLAFSADACGCTYMPQRFILEANSGFGFDVAQI